MDLLGLSEDELCAILEADPLTLLSGPLQRRRAQDLRPSRPLGVGLGRLLVVHQPPQPVEELAPEEAREQPEHHRKRFVDQLHESSSTTPRPIERATRWRITPVPSPTCP